MCRDSTDCKEALFGSECSFLLFKLISTLTGGLRFDHEAGECGSAAPIILQILSYALQILLPALFFLFAHDELTLLQFVAIYCGFFLVASLPLALIGFCGHRKNESSSCLEEHLRCLPEIKTLADLITGLAIAVLSAASQVFLAWDSFSGGLGLMVMTPFFMNCFFGHPPAESALFDL